MLLCRAVLWRTSTGRFRFEMETNTPVIVLSGMRVRKLQNQAGVSMVKKRLTSPSALEGNKFHQLNKPPFGKLTSHPGSSGKGHRGGLGAADSGKWARAPYKSAQPLQSSRCHTQDPFQEEGKGEKVRCYWLRDVGSSLPWPHCSWSSLDAPWPLFYS